MMSIMNDTMTAASAATHTCIRCGTRRSESEMIKVGSGWACHIGGGTTCAMQLIYRGYGHE